MKKCTGFVLPLTAVLLFASALTTTLLIMSAIQEHREKLYRCRLEAASLLQSSKRFEHAYQDVSCEALQTNKGLQVKPDKSFLK